MSLGVHDGRAAQLERTLAAIGGVVGPEDYPRVAELERELDPLLGRELERWLADVPHAPGAASRELIAAGGKRVRPMLAFLAAGAAGRSPRDALPVAVAAELLHSATLLHDDVIDEGDLRRGVPTARRVYGNAMSVLAGDFCFFAALDALCARGDHELIARATRVAHRLVEGELMQLERRAGVATGDFSESDYDAVVARKTGSLFAFACGGAARCAGADTASSQVLERFGELFGIAFQIADDLVDIIGDSAEAGKSLGQDVREGNVTLPILLALRERPELAEEVRAIAQIPADTSDRDERAEALLDAVRATSAVVACGARARAVAAEAQATLTGLTPSAYRDCLADMVSQLA